MTRKSNPALDEFAQRELDGCKRAFDAGNFLALADAIFWCKKCQYPAPEWVLEATLHVMRDSLYDKFGKRRGRTGNRLARFRSDFIHFVRWDFVALLRRHQENRRTELRRLSESKNISAEAYRNVAANIYGAGRTWDDAFYHAHLELRGSMAQGSPAAMRASYKLIERAGRDAFAGRDTVCHRSRLGASSPSKTSSRRQPRPGGASAGRLDQGRK